MPRLIHPNGPPGIGKSTLADMYVDDHPGTLNLDIDQMRCLIGGWRDRFAETGELVRPIALSMAGTHLRAGRDVIMPQYLGRLGEIERFEAVAHDNGAVFCEIVLVDTRQRSLERFARRGEAAELPWRRHVQEVVDHNGGPSFLADMHDRLTAHRHQDPRRRHERPTDPPPRLPRRLELHAAPKTRHARHQLGYFVTSPNWQRDVLMSDE